MNPDLLEEIIIAIMIVTSRYWNSANSIQIGGHSVTVGRSGYYISVIRTSIIILTFSSALSSAAELKLLVC